MAKLISMEVKPLEEKLEPVLKEPVKKQKLYKTRFGKRADKYLASDLTAKQRAHRKVRTHLQKKARKRNRSN